MPANLLTLPHKYFPTIFLKMERSIVEKILDGIAAKSRSFQDIDEYFDFKDLSTVWVNNNNNK